MSHPRIQRFGDVVLIDTLHADLEAAIGVYLLPLDDGRFALIEAGPESTLPAVRAGIEAAGFELRDLAAVLVTHIHLDHAGAAGALAELTDAHVYVHERGAEHLIDPARLLSSAERIYGDDMGWLWGTMRPIPDDRVTALSDGDLIEVGGRTLTAIDSPGHAGHHHCYLLEDGTLFTGDAAAVRLPGTDLIRPALPPPETNLEHWEATIAKLRALEPRRLLLTHFGEVRDADAHLSALLERNRAWAEEILEGLRAGEDDAALVRRMHAREVAELVAVGADAATIERHRKTSSAEMTVMGLSRYWRKHHPELLSEAQAG